MDNVCRHVVVDAGMQNKSGCPGTLGYILHKVSRVLLGLSGIRRTRQKLEAAEDNPEIFEASIGPHEAVHGVKAGPASTRGVAYELHGIVHMETRLP